MYVCTYVVSHDSICKNNLLLKLIFHNNIHKIDELVNKNTLTKN